MRTSSWHSSAYKFVGMYVWCMYLCWVRVRELLNQSIQQFLITFRLFCCKSKGMSISCYRSFDSSRRGQTLSLSHTHILFLWYFGHPQWIHLESTQPFWLHNIEIEKSMHRTDFSGAFGRWILVDGTWRPPNQNFVYASTCMWHFLFHCFCCMYKNLYLYYFIWFGFL